MFSPFRFNTLQYYKLVQTHNLNFDQLTPKFGIIELNLNINDS